MSEIYLVTGGAGFIGSNIVEELLRQGKKVRILDNFSTGKRSNITAVIEKLEKELKDYNKDNLEVVEGDIRSYHIVRKTVEGCSYILHQAALPSVPRSINDPISSNETNVVGTLNILNAAVETGVKRITYASSSSIYGDTAVLPKTEEMLPNPLSPYAVSKLAGEKYCQVFAKLYSLETVCLRYFNVFGPRQDPSSQYSAVIPKFIKIMENDEKPTIFGDGSQSRDFTFIENVVQANLLACHAPAEDVAGQVFNAAYGKLVNLNDLVEEINVILKKDIEPEYAGHRPGDILHSLANVGKARQIMGYEPKVSFEEGLKRTAAWMKAYKF